MGFLVGHKRSRVWVCCPPSSASTSLVWFIRRSLFRSSIESVLLSTMTVALPMAFDAAEDNDLMKSLNMLDAEFAPFSDEELAMVGDDLLAFGGSGSLGDSSPFSVDDFLVPTPKPTASLPAGPAPVVAPMVPLAELHSKQSSSPHSSGDSCTWAAPPSRVALVGLETSTQLPRLSESAVVASQRRVRA